MPRVSLDTLIRTIVREVIAELKRQGVDVVGASGGEDVESAMSGPPSCREQRPDLSAYKTPVLTEAHVQGLSARTEVVRVPRGTVVTPRARETLKAKRITLQFEL